MTYLLLNALTRSAPSRIVYETSTAASVGYFNWDDPRGATLSSTSNLGRGLRAYGTTKVMMELWAQVRVASWLRVACKRASAVAPPCLLLLLQQRIVALLASSSAPSHNSHERAIAVFIIATYTHAPACCC